MIHVEVGLVPTLQAAVGQGDPPIPLRFGQGSRTQLLDCDHANRNADDEIESGCFTGYATNPAGDCSAFGNGDLPPQNYFNTPTPNCIAVANGSTVGQVGQASTVGSGNGCGVRSAPQQLGPLPVRQRHPGRRQRSRYVVLIVTDIDLFNGGGAGQVPIRKFSGGGAGKVPVRRFAGFYVTGWSSASNACAQRQQQRGPAAGNLTSSKQSRGLGTLRELRCNDQQQRPRRLTCATFDDAEICVAVLTR